MPVFSLFKKLALIIIFLTTDIIEYYWLPFYRLYKFAIKNKNFRHSPVLGKWGFILHWSSMCILVVEFLRILVTNWNFTMVTHNVCFSIFFHWTCIAPLSLSLSLSGSTWGWGWFLGIPTSNIRRFPASAQFVETQ